MALPKQVQAQVHVAEEYDKQVAAAQLAAEPKPEDEQQTNSESEPEKQSQEPVSVETPKAKLDGGARAGMYEGIGGGMTISRKR